MKRTVWQAETYTVNDELASIDFPERDTAEEAIADARSALSRLTPGERDRYGASAGAIEWTVDDETDAKNNTGRTYEIHGDGTAEYRKSKLVG